MTGEGPVAYSEDLLSAWLDGACTDAEAAAVEAALASSPEARERLAEVTSARSLVRGLPTPEPPPGFWDRVVAVVEADGASDASDLVVADPASAGVRLAPVVPIGRRRATTRWLAAAGAAVAAAVVAAVVLVPQPGRVTPPVGALVDAHALRSSVQSDVASTLAPLALSAGFHR
ncbi:MAG: zf-HC2 domain-containing protein [Actinomycetes bacterium]